MPLLSHRPPARHSALAAIAALALGAVVAATATPLRAQDSVAVRTTADSSYTEAQASRGEGVFTRVCLECHERAELASADFRLKWGGQTTFDLFQSIFTTMPDSDPGSLPRPDYVDVVAYILKLNGIPAGATELADDSASMSAARLVLPAAEGGSQWARGSRARPVPPRLAFAHRRVRR